MDMLVKKMQKLTQNLWWTWKPEVRTIFRDLDLELYQRAHQNPMSVLRQISPEELENRATEVDVPARVDRALRQLQEYLLPVTTWGLTHAGALGSRPVAYFCMEFGIHESLPIYSGGLGILAGDHLKAASDLGVPLVGVGLLYHEGYTSQVLDKALWQQDVVEPFDIQDLPLTRAVDRHGEPVQVAVELPGRLVYASVLQVMVGRIRLILLDTRVKQNDPKDVALTARLYGGDQRMRIEQELLLGVGGARALRALGINASVFHLNEGHSAFALLERARYRIQEDGMEPHKALQEVASATVFTTHTPVDAGHDRFPADLAAEHLRPLAEGLKLSLDEVMGLGRVNPHDHGSYFLPTVLALKLSRRANGVSALHGVVSRKMWNHLYPGLQEEAVPIGHVTNGVHLPTWLATEMNHLYESHLGVDYQSSLTRPATWGRITSVSSAEIWETKQVLKARTIRFIRGRSAEMRERLGLPPIEPAPLDPEALTIGFTRRFVPYKRPDLLFTDLDRLDRLVNHPERPVNLVFSGRAHPADHTGKGLIQKVVKLLEDPRFRHRIVQTEHHDRFAPRRFACDLHRRNVDIGAAEQCANPANHARSVAVVGQQHRALRYKIDKVAVGLDNVRFATQHRAAEGTQRVGCLYPHYQQARIVLGVVAGALADPHAALAGDQRRIDRRDPLGAVRREQTLDHRQLNGLGIHAGQFAAEL